MMRRIVFILGIGVFQCLSAFTFDDIHYWVGEGTCAAGVVICWEGVTRAWGIRWNGAITIKAALDSIVEEDSRLRSDASLKKFSYDDYGDVAVRSCAFGFEFSVVSSSSMLPPGSSFVLVDSEATMPAGGWLKACPSSLVAIAEPTAAETPYGWRVVGSATDASSSYCDPSVVLGSPSRSMTVPSIGLPSGASGETAGTYVIHPAYPAWLSGRLFSIVGGDDEDNPHFVTIEFDHDVVDDPANPFGVDFIVFGNSLCSKKGGPTLLTPLSDPSSCSLTALENSEESVVEVAQYPNGPWYGSDEWRTSDGFAPTLGYRYDPDNVDTNLYAGNQWWGAKTDATFPVDPRIGFSDCAGLTLAELCQRYNGSAGGTGYDLADADGLPSDAAHGGRKWFRYVKISCAYSEVPNDDGDFGFTEPEVDAVADVAPVSGYKNWVLNNFTWDKAWQTNLTAATAIAPNGLSNGLNCVYGLRPTEAAADVPFKVESFKVHATNCVITMRAPRGLTATPEGLIVRSYSSLGGDWKKVVPTILNDGYPRRLDDGTYENAFTVPKGDEKFFKLALDEE